MTKREILKLIKKDKAILEKLSYGHGFEKWLSQGGLLAYDYVIHLLSVQGHQCEECNEDIT